jgi:hypothetical protein
MAGTTSSSVQQLYADIVADLVPYYMDAVLLPNQEIIKNSLIVSGTTGDQVRFPLTNSYTSAANVNEGTSIKSSAQSNLVPTAANVTFQKRGVATDVSEESLEDGGLDMVRDAVLTRLSGGLAQATDVAGLAQAKTSFTSNDGVTGANVKFKQSFIMSPEAMAYAAKREPVVKVWYNPNLDSHEFRGTVRNGFTALRATFGRTIKSAALGEAQAKANVEAIAQSVANLRAANAPTGIDGMYIGMIDPGFEFAINQQLAQVGGSTISSLSDIGNNALRDATIAMIAGTKLFRSNNLPDAS